MRKNKGKLGCLLIALSLAFGQMGGALAYETSVSGDTTAITLNQGEYYTYSVQVPASENKYASAQFEIAISDKNALTLAEITFSSAITGNGKGGSSVVSAGRDSGSQGKTYLAGFFANDNVFQNETDICTIKFHYTGSSAVTVTLSNLERATGDTKTKPGELILETQKVTWGKTIAFTRSTSGGDTGGTGSSAPSTPAESLGVTITGTADAATGKVIAAVDAATSNGFVGAAKAAEANGRKALVEIELPTAAQTKSVAITVPGDAFRELASQTDAGVSIKTGIGTVTFDAKAVEAISKTQTSGDVKVDIAKADPSALPDGAKQKVGDRPVYELSVTVGGVGVPSFGAGGAAVSVPYTLRPGEDKNAVVIYYLDGAGNMQPVRGAYNEAIGTVDFSVSHFSVYAVGYNQVRFADVAADAWYQNAVTFLAARGITNGTAADRFSPDAAITRGQFIVLLMRAYGIEPDTNTADNFADAGDTYYTNYLAAAKRLCISTGVGENRFAPESEITRQDMFTLLYRSLDMLGELPEADSDKTLLSFGDASEIASYAKGAMEILIQGGIVNGSDGRLDPRGYSTRAQMAQVLFNLLA